MRYATLGAIVVLGLTWTGSALAQHWDSSRDFSGTQGQWSWLYGYQTYAGGTFLFPVYNTNPAWYWGADCWVIDTEQPAPAYETMISRTRIAPNGSSPTPGFTPADHMPMLAWMNPCQRARMMAVSFTVLPVYAGCPQGSTFVQLEHYGSGAGASGFNIVCTRYIDVPSGGMTACTNLVNTLPGDFLLLRVDGFAGSQCDALDYVMTIEGPCSADIDDGSGTGTPDGYVTIADANHMATLYMTGDLRGDIAGSGYGNGCGLSDGVTDANDMLCFLLRYSQGCP